MPDPKDLISQAQAFLRRPASGADAWLLYDYRGLNPFFWQVVGPVPNVTRPCWLLIPPRGKPRLLAHHVDVGRFASTSLPVTAFASRHCEGRLRTFSIAAPPALRHPAPWSLFIWDSPCECVPIMTQRLGTSQSRCKRSKLGDPQTECTTVEVEVGCLRQPQVRE